ncbi:hypothetical protein FDG2_0442 [Candidatus Protofrankia californiensis]|uniref:Uncharacterized protein n=1 Tax=Candidatus Protofrankia californiensis TaxID=1839754 RepID=A0A1C3NTP9_9ACTN|nr:hypothetical protein FDG2_0442 [Candidatus Protofrankia californiensis]
MDRLPQALEQLGRCVEGLADTGELYDDRGRGHQNTDEAKAAAASAARDAAVQLDLARGHARNLARFLADASGELSHLGVIA